MFAYIYDYATKCWGTRVFVSHGLFFRESGMQTNQNILDWSKRVVSSENWKTNDFKSVLYENVFKLEAK